MYRRFAFALAFLSLGFAAAASARAQSGRAGLISAIDARRAGLERVWFTRVVVDSARGGIGHMRQHVNSKRSYTVYQVQYDGGKINYSERDLDRFGDRLGKEGAEKLAQQKVEELELRKLSPKLEEHTIPEITLFVTTTRGVIQAIDAETGRTRWATEVGNPRHFGEAPAANDDFVAVINGTHLFVLDSASGQIVWERGTRGAPGAGPAITNRYVFVPMVSGAVESYQLDNPKLPPWVFRSQGRAMVQPISTGSVVAWPTDQGALNVAEANRNNVLYRIETNNSIVAPATALPGSRLLAASTDGYVYCVHELSGALLWRFSTGEPISSSPISLGDAIFVVTEGGSLFRLNAISGMEEWWTSGVYGFAAASSGRLYCFDRSGSLVVLNEETGAKSARLSTPSLDIHLENKQTDRIFIGTRRGVIQCLREPNQEWPLLHVDLAEAAAPVPQRPPQRATPDAAEPPPTSTDPFGGGGADPFGGGGGADPFGGGSGTGGSTGSGSDPFGSDPFGGGTGGGSGTTEPDPFGSDPFN